MRNERTDVKQEKSETEWLHIRGCEGKGKRDPGLLLKLFCLFLLIISQFSSVAQSCLTLCNPMDCSTPGLPVHHQLPKLTQIHVLWVSDDIQPSHPLSFPCISFSWGWSQSLPPVQCHEPPSTVLQALCLSDQMPWIYLSLPLYSCKGFDLGHSWMV